MTTDRNPHMTDNENDIREQRFRKVSAVLKLVLLILIVAGMPLYIYFFHKDFISNFSDIDSINAVFRQYRTQSVFIYIGAQILQIVICIIPGQVLQLAAGYFYGIIPGLLLSLAGAVLGSAAVYYIARILGRDAIHMLFGKKKVTEMISHMNSRKGLIITFIIFLIPGIPKDLCSYVAGLTDLKLKPYLIVSLIGRTPGMLGSLIIGQQLEAGGYMGAIIIAAAAAVLFIAGMIYRKKIIDICNKACDKLLDTD